MIADVEQELIERLLANLPTGFASVKAPGARFSTPNGKWIRATLTAPVAIDRDASNCFKQYEGIFVVDVFDSKNEGSRRALEAAEEIQNTFQNLQLTEVFCSDAEIAIPGEDDNWYHVQVNITYQFGSYTGV